MREMAEPREREVSSLPEAQAQIDGRQHSARGVTLSTYPARCLFQGYYPLVQGKGQNGAGCGRLPRDGVLLLGLHPGTQRLGQPLAVG